MYISHNILSKLIQLSYKFKI